MKTILKWIVLAPLAAAVVVFAVVNRQQVAVSFDPFGEASAALTVKTPLFVALFAAAAIGVVLGGVATWLDQGRHRRAGRESRAQAARLKAELDRAPPPSQSKALEHRPAA